MAPRKNVRKPRKYGRRPYKSGVRKAVRKYRKANFAKAVRKVITRMAEKKVINSNFTLSPRCIQNLVTDLTGNYYRMTPTASTVNGWNISQGDTSQMRTGNKVTTKKCYLDYVLAPLPYNLANNTQPVPQIVRIFFFKKKNNSTNVSLASSDFIQSSGNFLENGGSTTGFAGNLTDLNRHINPENYTYLCHRTHKLGFAYYQGSGQVTTYGQMSNTDYKMNIISRVDLTKYMPKVVVWDDDGVVNTPTIYMLIQTLQADNNVNLASTNLNWLPISFAGSLNFHYTDL